MCPVASPPGCDRKHSVFSDINTRSQRIASRHKMENHVEEHIKVEVVDVQDRQFDAANEDTRDVGIEMEIGQEEYRQKTKKTKKNIPAWQSVKAVRRSAELKLGIRVIFAPKFKSKFDIRTKVTVNGQTRGEALVENSRIHNTEGHIVFVRSETKNFRHDSHSPDVDQGQSSLRNQPPFADRKCLRGKPDLNGTSMPRKSDSFDAMEMTLEDVKNVQYFSTSKEETYQRREKMACSAEKATASEAQAIRIPYV